ncbi:MAG: hypothetical protein ACP5UQ_07155 [Anaerolineae bacterium]
MVRPVPLLGLWLLHGQGVRAAGELIRRKLALYDLELTPQIVQDSPTGRGGASRPWRRIAAGRWSCRGRRTAPCGCKNSRRER